MEASPRSTGPLTSCSMQPIQQPRNRQSRREAGPAAVGCDHPLIMPQVGIISVRKELRVYRH